MSDAMPAPARVLKSSLLAVENAARLPENHTRPVPAMSGSNHALLRAASLLHTAQQEAEEIREDARQEREALLAAARQEAETIRQQAYQEGLAAGRREGEEAARAELEALFTHAHKLVQEALAFQERMMGQARQDLLHLALAIASKIIGEKLEKPGVVATRALREALLRYRPSGQIITVRVNLQDLDAVEARKEEFIRLCQGTREWRVVADDQVGPGGCLIETDQGIIDGRVESRFTAVQNALQESMNEESGSDQPPAYDAVDARAGGAGAVTGEPSADIARGEAV